MTNDDNTFSKSQLGKHPKMPLVLTSRGLDYLVTHFSSLGDQLSSLEVSIRSQARNMSKLKKQSSNQERITPPSLHHTGKLLPYYLSNKMWIHSATPSYNGSKQFNILVKEPLHVH